MGTQRYGSEVIYVSNVGWHIWDETRWQFDEKANITQLAKDVAFHIRDEVDTLISSGDDNEDEKAASAILSWSTQSGNKSRLKAMVDLVSSESRVSRLRKELDGNPYLFNVSNGTLDLKTGDLMAPRKADLITKKSPIKYKAKAECYEFLRFLDTIFLGDQELIRYIQWLFGYCLIGHNHTEKFYILNGDGANGKSTLLKCLLGILGDDYGYKGNKETVFSSRKDGELTQQASLALWNNMRGIVLSESNFNSVLSEGLVKELTSEGVEVQQKYRDPFRMRPTFKILLMTQHVPIVNGHDDGIWRRLRLIPFTYTFPEDKQDDTFFEKVLTPELPGILRWAVEGAKLYQAIREDIIHPERMKHALAEWRSGSDVFGTFIDDCFDLVPDAWVSSEDLLKVSKVYGTENNFKRLKEGSAKWMKSTLENHTKTKDVVSKKDKPTGKGYKGLHLKTSARLKYLNPNFSIHPDCLTNIKDYVSN